MPSRNGLCLNHAIMLSRLFWIFPFALAIELTACRSLDLPTVQRQTQSGQPSCELVNTGYGPTGTSAVHLETVVNGLEVPWGLAFIPGGDILLTERPGRIRLVHGGALVDAPVTQVQVVNDGEGGLLGIALHPQFASNSFFYVFATVTENGNSVNRVERYHLSADHKSATFDRVILDGIQAGSIHDGGRIHFGPDGMLYVSTGNALQIQTSQDPNSVNGKILRLTPDGAIPFDNPQPGKPWFLLGLRNAHGFDWIDSGTLVVADNGPTGEYMNRTGGDKVMIAHAGNNLGWPTLWHCESQPGLLNPILTWIDAVPPGGAAVYRGNAIPGWYGNVIVGTLGSEHLHRIVLGANNQVSSHEVYFQGQPPKGAGRLREVVSGPDGELYVTTSNCDSRGTCPASGDAILRVRPTVVQ